MFWNSLNEESMQRINNIVNGFKSHPLYAAYTIKTYCYDFRLGVQAIEVGKNGDLVNLWLFYPDATNGNINSIAVYGSMLRGHLNAIRSTMTVFGMPVDSAELDKSGLSDFVDICLKQY